MRACSHIFSVLSLFEPILSAGSRFTKVLPLLEHVSCLKAFVNICYNMLMENVLVKGS